MPVEDLKNIKGEKMSGIHESIRKVFWVNYFLSIFLCVWILNGCASSKTTYKKTTVQDTNPPATSTTTTITHDSDNAPTSVTTTTKNDDTGRNTTVKEETTTTKSQGDGLFGSFFHFIGQVIVFPFKVIGGLFRAIF